MTSNGGVPGWVLSSACLAVLVLVGCRILWRTVWFLKERSLLQQIAEQAGFKPLSESAGVFGMFIRLIPLRRDWTWSYGQAFCRDTSGGRIILLELFAKDSRDPDREGRGGGPAVGLLVEASGVQEPRMVLRRKHPLDFSGPEARRAAFGKRKVVHDDLLIPEYASAVCSPHGIALLLWNMRSYAQVLPVLDSLDRHLSRQTPQ